MGEGFMLGCRGRGIYGNEINELGVSVARFEGLAPEGVSVGVSVGVAVGVKVGVSVGV